MSTWSGLAAVIDALPDGICVFSAGALVYANSALARLLGGAPPLGCSIVDFAARWLPPEQRASFVADLQIEPVVARRAQRRYLGPQGELDVETDLTPLTVEGGSAVMLVSRDVSERGRMEARLLQTDRMASIGTLAAGITHEINNPLALVVANLQFVGDRLAGGGDPELDEALTHAREGALRVQLVVQQLRSFSRGGDEKHVPVDLKRVLDAAVEMVGNEIRHRAQLIRHDDPIDAILGNEAQLVQVFVNLLVNAAHAIPESGAGKHEIRLTLKAEPTHAVIEVSDTGGGIAPENLRKLFEPFFTTKPIGVGTGLGLAICHGIVAAHKGDITVESQLGRGSTFRVTLPLPTRVHEALPPPKNPTPNQQRRGRVLVIDDEPRIGAAVRRTLILHEVVVMQRARDALTAIAAGDSFDLVLCDLMMPEMSGMDFFAELSREYPELARRVIFLTGGAFTPRAQTFLAEVPNARMDKPFDPKQLRALVQTLLR